MMYESFLVSSIHVVLHNSQVTKMISKVLNILTCPQHSPCEVACCIQVVLVFHLTLLNLVQKIRSILELISEHCITLQKFIEIV